MMNGESLLSKLAASDVGISQSALIPSPSSAREATAVRLRSCRSRELRRDHAIAARASMAAAAGESAPGARVHGGRDRSSPAARPMGVRRDQIGEIGCARTSLALLAD